MDIVYIFGKGSIWKNNELIYSLRSVEKHLKEFNNVFLIGYKPKFMSSEVIEVPYKDIFPNKQRNIMSKIYRACNDERISENFIVFNDDYILLKDHFASGYEYFYDKRLEETIKRCHNSYRNCLEETENELIKLNKPTLHFDIHRPIIYNKDLFKEMANSYNWNTHYGYTVKSLYCNHHEIKGTLKEDCKINYPYKHSYIEKEISNLEMISLGDKALNSPMKAFLMNRFPNKSKFEI